MSDPLASLAAPSVPPAGSCVLISPNNYSCSPGYYASISVPNGTTYTFAPGTYYVNGNLTVSGTGIATGSGVFFYDFNGTVNISGTGAFNLSAPTSGVYKDVLIFQARTNTRDATISKDTNMQLNGTIYVPGNNARLTYNGGGPSSKTSIIADRVRENVNNGSAYLGGSIPGPGAKLVQ